MKVEFKVIHARNKYAFESMCQQLYNEYNNDEDKTISIAGFSGDASGLGVNLFALFKITHTDLTENDSFPDSKFKESEIEGQDNDKK